jgi:HK97 gp10 family phage protein
MLVGRVRPQVLAALTQVPDVKRQVRENANAVRREARRLAPKRTGALRRSLTVENVYDPATKRVHYRVGWDRRVAFYGPIVELGTSRAAARPHLRPAAERYGAVPPSSTSPDDRAGA